MIKHEALTELSSGIVVDSAKLAALGPARMAAFFAGLYAEPPSKRIVIVDNSLTFFSSKNLFKELDEGGENWPIICEHFEITLDQRDIDSLHDAVRVRQLIAAAIKAKKPAYALADVPKNWSVENNIRITANYIQRLRNNNEGDTASYTIGVKMLERVWLAASAVWAGVEGAKNTISDVRAGDYTRTATVFKDRIEVGCQSIRRYEIEQIALHKGWAFP